MGEFKGLCSTAKTKSNMGFTLLELAIVLIIAGVLMVMAAETFKTYVQYRQVQVTKDNVDYALEKIKSFQQKYGFLPCPASPTDPMLRATDCSDNTAQPGMVVGQATGVNGQTIRIGVLPVSYTDPDTGRVTQFVAGDKTIDGWKNRLTYAVVEQMAQTPAAFTAAGVGTITVDNVPVDPANPITQSARYVLFSHGPDGVGAYSQNGALRAPCVDGASIDSENCDGDAVFSGRMESPRSNTEDANNFDDFISSDDDDLGAITCPDNQEMRGYNLTTKEPICAARDLECSPSDGSFVGVEWINDAASPTGKTMKAICKPFTTPCNAGTVLASVEIDAEPVCIQNNQGACPDGYVQSGFETYIDENKDGLDDKTGATVAFGVLKCAKISGDCGPDKVQVGVSDGSQNGNEAGSSGIPAGQPLCADRMKGDTCRGDQIVVGYKPDGTPQCSDVPHCTGGKVVSGIDDNGNVICTPSIGPINCPDGQVIRSVIDGKAKCEKLATNGDVLIVHDTGMVYGAPKINEYLRTTYNLCDASGGGPSCLLTLNNCLIDESGTLGNTGDPAAFEANTNKEYCQKWLCQAMFPGKAVFFTQIGGRCAPGDYAASVSPSCNTIPQIQYYCMTN